jgi:hypothetical protein
VVTIILAATVWRTPAGDTFGRHSPPAPSGGMLLTVGD